MWGVARRSLAIFNNKHENENENENVYYTKIYISICTRVLIHGVNILVQAYGEHSSSGKTHSIKYWHNKYDLSLKFLTGHQHITKDNTIN